MGVLEDVSRRQGREPTSSRLTRAATGGSRGAKTITFSAALIQIVIADASMSLDNVLAVAGAAKGDMVVLVIGLVVAVAFMGFMSHYIARLLTRA